MCELCARHALEYEPATPASRAAASMISEADHWNAFHAVVEDGNVDDKNVLRCASGLETERERQLYEALVALSPEQRLTAIAIHEGILPEHYGSPT